jgi:hypothetical protein
MKTEVGTHTLNLVKAPAYPMTSRAIELYNQARMVGIFGYTEVVASAFGFHYGDDGANSIERQVHVRCQRNIAGGVEVVGGFDALFDFQGVAAVVLGEQGLQLVHQVLRAVGGKLSPLISNSND